MSSAMQEGVTVERLALPGLMTFTPARHGDERGFFSEVYNRDVLARIGIVAEFVQDNHSFSASNGIIRGLHFQSPPFEQAKMVRVTRGEVLDVVVDIRAGSPTFGQHVAVRLSAENWKQLWVPAGFAHGLCTLTENVEVIYKVTNFYSREHDLGLAYDDSDLAIDWPVEPGSAILSERDRHHPRLRDLPTYFNYDG